MNITNEHIRAAGGIVHSDGNIFFTNLEKPNAAVLAAQPAPVQEPVAICHDDGHWTPLKTDAGRAFNEKLMQAGTRATVYATPPAQPAAPLSPLALAVVDAARAAMDESEEANDGEGGIKITSERAASLSLRLDEYDRAIKAAHNITAPTQKGSET